MIRYRNQAECKPRGRTVAAMAAQERARQSFCDGETMRLAEAVVDKVVTGWEKGTEPKKIGWYAGMQYDGDVANAKEVPDELDKY